ncbi:serine hydrolase [Nocardia seriolae]|uniref:Beta-lactamase n=1 Tax=Nocardia seriolae TaxID=37332 RepID=A0A0B8NGD4_9NOCA|nr:serine hydrolase [Nocardia seriolae]APB01091.1 Beta-lactamase [Nocardia seriolae]MTJ65615.1 serine hydrolase [Nocardia seriolae]MTJ72738.1 serine hydrolase [Nocardia seriolae]MTJ90492.1 serine hydrolase [Nocardia seriolae]MTK34452.1 serine hydrolase [Nocardia seriolae]
MDEIFRTAGVEGRVHARCFDCDGEFGWGADEPVVLSSVVKVPLVLEFARQVAAGQLDATDRVRATAADRLGGVGTAGCLDDVEYSLRDAAYFALTVSDNTAADLLFDRVGVDNVRSLVRELGLTRTRVDGSLRDILYSMAEDIGARDLQEFARRYPESSAAEVFGSRAVDPLRTTASTPRDMTRMLLLIGQDLAGVPEACGWVRDLMRRQVFGHRLPSGFAPGTDVWSKTGTLPGIRNEIGVVGYPDGSRYAIAVFTVSHSLAGRQPAVDRAIGEAARQAVERIAHGLPATTSHGRRCGTSSIDAV